MSQKDGLLGGFGAMSSHDEAFGDESIDEIANCFHLAIEDCLLFSVQFTEDNVDFVGSFMNVRPDTYSQTIRVRSKVSL